jgi:Sporulation and spore germination
VSDPFDPMMDQHPDRHGGLRAGHLVAIAVVAAAVLGAVLWLTARGPEAPEAPEPARVEPVPEGSRTVTLYFAGADEPVMVSEPREVAVGHRIDEQLRQVVDALLAGPEDPKAVSAIPADTRLLTVMVDTDSGTVYLDFSSELVASHPGGSAAEYCTVASVVRTVGENFPEVQKVQILVDGSQIETIAGHIRADEPFYVRDWR